ncbi:hypothetical protein ACQ86N_00905 [Puia sp. P3]
MPTSKKKIRVGTPQRLVVLPPRMLNRRRMEPINNIFSVCTGIAYSTI